MSSKRRAVEIQILLDEHFGFDIASLTNSEVRNLKTKLEEFLTLDVDTDDMKPADEYTQRDLDSL